MLELIFAEDSKMHSIEESALVSVLSDTRNSPKTPVVTLISWNTHLENESALRKGKQ